RRERGRLRAGARAARTVGRREAVDGLPAQRLLLRDGHLPRVQDPQRPVGRRRGPVEGVGMSASFWQDRPTLVTGATGLVGGWVVRRLLDAGAQVVCLVRDWVPGCELVRGRLVEQTVVVRADVRDQAAMERALGEYEIDTVVHLAAQTIVGIANRNPVSTFEANVQGTWALLEACRRSPRVKQIVVASSDKAYGDQEKLPYDEATPL